MSFDKIPAHPWESYCGVTTKEYFVAAALQANTYQSPEDAAFHAIVLADAIEKQLACSQTISFTNWYNDLYPLVDNKTGLEKQDYAVIQAFYYQDWKPEDVAEEFNKSVK